MASAISLCAAALAALARVDMPIGRALGREEDHMDIRPFTIAAPQQALDDLQQRLDLTRWPDEIPGGSWRFGADLTYMRSLVDYWQSAFDWRAQERALNAFAHFQADIDGLGVHFIHAHGVGLHP